MVSLHCYKDIATYDDSDKCNTYYNYCDQQISVTCPWKHLKELNVYWEEKEAEMDSMIEM